MKSEHKKRGRRPLEESERKHKIIQARVPEELDEALKEAAEKHQVSVSQLLRNLLQDTFQLVDTLVADSANLVDNVKRDAKKIAASAKSAQTAAKTQTTPQIAAWQVAISNHDSHCQVCNKPIAAGSQAWLGIGPNLRDSIWRCADCLPGQKQK